MISNQKGNEHFRKSCHKFVTRFSKMLTATTIPFYIQGLESGLINYYQLSVIRDKQVGINKCQTKTKEYDNALLAT